VEGPVLREHGDDVPHELVVSAAQRGHQPRAHDRGLAAARRADHGDEVALRDRLDELLREALAAAEERLVFLTERTQAPVWTDRRQRVGDALLQIISRGLAASGSHQHLDHVGRRALPQIDPGIEAEEAERRIGAGQQDGNDGEAAILRLAVERALHLALLPAAHPERTEKDRRGGAFAEHFFQRGDPGLTRHQIPAIEKNLEAAAAQFARHHLDRVAVAPMIAYEQVVHGVLPLRHQSLRQLSARRRALF
jgi:hypothetical protein